MTLILHQVKQDLGVKMASRLLASTSAKLSACPLQANSPQHKQSYSGKEKKKKLFLRQIIKLHWHGAAFVMCFSMLRVVIPDRRLLRHLHSLGHSDVKIRGEALINLA